MTGRLGTGSCSYGFPREGPGPAPSRSLHGSMPHRRLGCGRNGGTLLSPSSVCGSPGRRGRPESPLVRHAGRSVQSTTRPTIEQYCLGCHSAEELEGELDLERFATLTDVRRDATVWHKVAEMLDHGEMPPKNAQAAVGRAADATAGLGRAVPERRGPGACRRSRAGGPAPAEQRRVHVHPARLDRGRRSTPPASSPSMAPRAKGSPTPATRW